MLFLYRSRLINASIFEHNLAKINFKVLFKEKILMFAKINQRLVPVFYLGVIHHHINTFYATEIISHFQSCKAAQRPPSMHDATVNNIPFRY